MEEAPNPIANLEKKPTKSTKFPIKDYFSQEVETPVEKNGSQSDFEKALERGERIIEIEMTLPVKVRIPEGVFFNCRGQYYDAWSRALGDSLKNIGVHLMNRGQLDCDLRKAFKELEPEILDDMNKYFSLQDELSSMLKFSNSGQGNIKTKYFDVEKAEQYLAQMQDIEKKLRKSTEVTEGWRKAFFSDVNEPPRQEVDEYELEENGMTREDYERMNPKQ